MEGSGTLYEARPHKRATPAAALLTPARGGKEDPMSKHRARRQKLGHDRTNSASNARAKMSVRFATLRGHCAFIGSHKIQAVTPAFLPRLCKHSLIRAECIGGKGSSGSSRRHGGGLPPFHFSNCGRLFAARSSRSLASRANLLSGSIAGRTTSPSSNAGGLLNLPCGAQMEALSVHRTLYSRSQGLESAGR